jgi:hypothetical protein
MVVGSFYSPIITAAVTISTQITTNATRTTTTPPPAEGANGIADSSRPNDRERRESPQLLDANYTAATSYEWPLYILELKHTFGACVRGHRRR